MSRKILGKIVVDGKLTALTPLSVGGLGTGEHVDLELAEDGTGHHYVPGTSLAGPMRSWLERHVKDEAVIRDIFGYIEQEGDGGKASVLYVSDSPIDDDVIAERRHGISIQDTTGTTKEGCFYTRALLPRGTCLKLRMELDILGEDYSAGALSLLIDALQTGKIRFGACKTRGMGAMKLEETKVNWYDFAGDSAALDLWLDGKDALRQGIEALSSFKRPELNLERAFTLSVPWRAVSPLMVKAGRDGIEADMLPLMSGIGGGNVAPVIPGSSIKGILRSQARKILNTLFNPEEGAEDWLIIEDMFGSKERAGRLMIDDVYHMPNSPVSRENWLKEDGTSMNSFTERHQYVAIDRFTGGASDKALYSARPVKKDESDTPGWDPIRLTLDVSNALSEENVKKEQALLKLLLRDMKEGYITIGFGSRRGLGEIEIEGDVDSIISSAGFPDDSVLQPAWDDFVSSGGKNFDVKKEADGNV